MDTRVLPGFLYVDEADVTGLRVKLRLAEDALTFATSDETLGAWTPLGTEVHEVGTERFRLVLGKESVLFAPDDPVEFKYEVVPLLGDRSTKRGRRRRRSKVSNADLGAAQASRRLSRVQPRAATPGNGKRAAAMVDGGQQRPPEGFATPQVTTGEASQPKSPARAFGTLEQPTAEVRQEKAPIRAKRASTSQPETQPQRRAPAPEEQAASAAPKGEPTPKTPTRVEPPTPQPEIKREAPQAKEATPRKKAPEPEVKAAPPRQPATAETRKLQPTTKGEAPQRGRPARPTPEPKGASSQRLSGKAAARVAPAARPAAKPDPVAADVTKPAAASEPLRLPTRTKASRDLVGDLKRKLRKEPTAPHRHSFSISGLPGGLIRFVCAECGHVSIDLTGDSAAPEGSGSLFRKGVRL